MDDHGTHPKPPQSAPEVTGRRKRLTLSHLAERLGVSTATISLALRNSPLVAQATRERVKREAEAAGYIYNRSAAALRTARSNVVGVAVHDILNPYFAEIFGALEDALGDSDQIVFICNHRDDVERQRTFVQALLQHRADGLVLCPSVGTEPAEINRLVDAGLPVTLICRDVEGARAPVVRGDDIAGTLEAVRHLIAAGHRDIAFLGGRRGSSTGRDRHEGWARALREAGIDPDAQLYEPEMMTRAHGFGAVDLLLAREPRPTAVMCFNDMVARGLIEALRRHDMEAGRDIAVIGYDDALDAATATPSLSTVNNGAAEIGARAASMILAQVSGEPMEANRVVVVPHFVERESTGGTRAD